MHSRHGAQLCIRRLPFRASSHGEASLPFATRRGEKCGVGKLQASPFRGGSFWRDGPSRQASRPSVAPARARLPARILPRSCNEREPLPNQLVSICVHAEPALRRVGGRDTLPPQKAPTLTQRGLLGASLASGERKRARRPAVRVANRPTCLPGSASRSPGVAAGDGTRWRGRACSRHPSSRSKLQPMVSDTVRPSDGFTTTASKRSAEV